MRDEELRAELASWVHEMAERPTPAADTVRRRARSRLLRRFASAGAVVVVIVGIALSVNAGLQGGSRTAANHQRHSGGPTAAGSTAPRWTWYPHAWFPAEKQPAADIGPSAAPYLVQITGAQFTSVASLASGGQIASVVEPDGASFVGVAAAGDDHTFLLAATAGRTVRFYEVRVGPGGQPGTPVLVLSIPLTSIEPSHSSGANLDFAISPDASMLAYSTVTGLEVVSLATGQATSWPATGSTDPFSWAGDDHTLALSWWSKSDQAQSGVRLLDTRATGSLLQASRLVIPNSVVATAGNMLMTADASKIFLSILSGGSGLNQPPTDGIVEEFSTRTGRMLTAVTPKVHVASSETSPNYLQCQVLWTDASGSQVASFCASSGAADGTGVLVDDNGHIVSTSLETPVTVENDGSDGEPPALYSSLFAW